MLSNKIEVLDSLRAFAALSVCLFHFVCTTTGYINEEWVINTFSVGQYGIHMFFVISGFVIPWSMYHANYKIKNFFSFFLKRLARLEPPYIFSIFLVIFVIYIRALYLGRSNYHAEISTTQVALHLGYLIPFFKDQHWLNLAYWSLAIEFQYYVFIALLFIPLMLSNLLVRCLIYASFIVASHFSPEMLLFYWLPLFLLGMVLFLFKTKRIFWIEFCLTSIVLLYYFSHRDPEGDPLSSAVYSAIPLVFVAFWQELKITGLHFLGKFSYSIYLIHPIIGASVINFLSHRFTGQIEKIVVILAGLTFTLISAWITYLLIERPSKNLSSSIKYIKEANKLILQNK